MRTTFIDELIKIAEVDERIVLITGDLGYSVLEPFQDKFPQRYINAGIAEQNMTGLAAGLAISGKIPVTYSIANFPTLRCLEQIRNDGCYHNASIKIVSVGSGFAYGTQGYTHHGIEDIAVMRALPNMRVLSPADPIETRSLVSFMCNTQGPCYLRLAKANEPNLHQSTQINIEAGFLPLIEGHDQTLLATGAITAAIYDWVTTNNIKVNLYSVPIIKPLNLNKLADILSRSTRILTVEEHQLSGGFGSAILESINQLHVDNKLSHFPLVQRFGVKNQINSSIDSQTFIDYIVNDLSEHLLIKEGVC